MLCDFHREQAWERWLSKTGNGCRSIKGLILQPIRRIANSDTEEEVQRSIKDLKDSDVWKNIQYKKFNTWFSKTWFPSKQVFDHFKLK